MSDRFFQYARLPVMSDLFPESGPVADYIASHTIEADVEGIWDRVTSERFHYHGSKVTHGWELMKWNVLTIYLDGQPLDHPNLIPADFPMAEVLAALEAAETGEQLHYTGPNR